MTLQRLKVLLFTPAFVLQEVRPLITDKDDTDDEQLNNDDRHSNPKEFLALFRSEEAYIDDLTEDYVENGHWNNLLSDDSRASEFRVVDETEIVLVDVVLEQEEANCKHWHVRDKRGEHHCDSEGG